MSNRILYLLLFVPLLLWGCGTGFSTEPPPIGGEKGTSSLQATVSALLPGASEVRSDLLRVLAAERPLLAPGAQPTLDIVALALYIDRGSMIEPVTPDTPVSALKDGDKIAVPFHFRYADPGTELTGIITYRLVYDAATTSFVYDTPPFTLVVDQHIDGSLLGTVVSLIADATNDLLLDNGFLPNVRIDAVRTDTGEPAGTTWTTTDGSYHLTLTGGYTYTIVAAADGWESLSRDLWLPPADTVSGIDFSLLPLATSTSGYGAVYGVVQDLTGNPVVGARIAAINGPNEKQALTNQSGLYILNGLAAGTWYIEMVVGNRVQEIGRVFVSPEDASASRWQDMSAVFSNHPPLLECPAEVNLVVGEVGQIAPSVSDPDGDTLRIEARIIDGLAKLLPRNPYRPEAAVEMVDGPGSTIRFTASDGAQDASCDVLLHPVDSLYPSLMPGYSAPSLTFASSAVYFRDLFDDGVVAPWETVYTWDPMFSIRESAGSLVIDTGYRSAGLYGAREALYRRPVVADNTGDFYITQSLTVGTETTGTVSFMTGVTGAGIMAAAGLTFSEGTARFELALRTVEGDLIIGTPVTLVKGTAQNLMIMYDSTQTRLTVSMRGLGATLSLPVAFGGVHLDPFILSRFGQSGTALSTDSRLVVRIAGISSSLIDLPATYRANVTPMMYLRQNYDRTDSNLPGVVFYTNGLWQEATADGTSIHVDGTRNLHAALVQFTGGAFGTVYTDVDASSLASLPNVSTIDLWIADVFTAGGPGSDFLYTGP